MMNLRIGTLDQQSQIPQHPDFTPEPQLLSLDSDDLPPEPQIITPEPQDWLSNPRAMVTDDSQDLTPEPGLLPPDPLDIPPESQVQQSVPLDMNSDFQDYIQEPVINPEPRIFPLYSDITKDADFVSVWKSLSKSLANENTSAFKIDFSGINWILDKEIGYLEKMGQIVSQQNGSLSLINCSFEIAERLSANPFLAPLIEPKNL